MASKKRLSDAGDELDAAEEEVLSKEQLQQMLDENGINLPVEKLRTTNNYFIKLRFTEEQVEIIRKVQAKRKKIVFLSHMGPKRFIFTSKNHFLNFFHVKNSFLLQKIIFSISDLKFKIFHIR